VLSPTLPLSRSIPVHMLFNFPRLYYLALSPVLPVLIRMNVSQLRLDFHLYFEC
jgi:hypothetical protein